MTKENIENSSEVNEVSHSNIFPQWVNILPRIILLAITGLVVFVVYLFWYWFTPQNFNVGYEPEQPIPYSHRLHVGQLGLDCRYCHTEVENAAHANIPPVETCMNCHEQIKTDSPHIQKLTEHYENDEPIEWVNVHVLPDHAYFDHSRHVNAGVGCVDCHGRVDQMEVVWQTEPLSMGWCLECHRNPEPNLRPREFVTQMDWETDESREDLGKKLRAQYHLNPREDCSACHR
ncbi:MAG: cytochrome C [Actinobacteria bacterium]|nr:cytochrome C [Actinomycetota bacterium]